MCESNNLTNHSVSPFFAFICMPLSSLYNPEPKISAKTHRPTEMLDFIIIFG